MTIQDYFKHYLSWPEAGIFFGIAIGSVIIVNLILFLCSHFNAGKHAANALDHTTAEGSVSERYEFEKRSYVFRRFRNLSQRFYELIFSGNCILFFMTVYYLINRFYNVEPYKSMLRRYESFLLLLLIVLSCILNSLLDKVFIRLGSLSREEQSAIKILGMFYMLIIFAYIKYIYENDNYDMFITYFLGLMVGRFVYFDASFKDFLSSIGRALANFPIMILGLACTGAMAYWGFKTKYLIKHIGVLTNVFIAHIFLCVAIFIIFHIHPENLFKPKNYKEPDDIPVTEA